MKLLLKRIAKKEKYTIGKLYLDGTYVCDTIEDKDRGLNSNMKTSEILKKKIKTQTAIPTGTYQLTINVVSPKFSKKSFYIKNANGGRVPRLLNVPGFDGILMHCLTPETEILTEFGWLNLNQFKDLNPTMCFSYNIEKKCIEKTPINFLIENDYDGELYCNYGKRINYKVTDKHKMFVGTRKRNGEFNWELRDADSIPSYSTKFLTSSYKEGDELDSEQKTFYRLLMAVQADGYILNWSKNSSQVRFHLKKERKIQRLKKLLDELDCKYKEFIGKDNDTHITLDSVFSRHITEMLNPNRSLTCNKTLPWELLNLKSEDLKDLLIEYLFWDGRWENYQKNDKNMCISTTNINTLNVLQAMATMSGFRTYNKVEHSKSNLGNLCYALFLFKDQEEVSVEPNTYTKENYNGKVWCINNDNHTIITRLNGRVVILGNCGTNENSSAGCLIVGYNKVVGKVINSQEAFIKLYGLLKKAKVGEKITIEII